MKKLQKVLLISGIALSLFGGIATAQAEVIKPEARHTSKVIVIPEPTEAHHHHHRHGHDEHRHHKKHCRKHAHMHRHMVRHVIYEPVYYPIYRPIHHHYRPEVIRLPIWLTINI